MLNGIKIVMKKKTKIWIELKLLKKKKNMYILVFLEKKNCLKFNEFKDKVFAPNITLWTNSSTIGFSTQGCALLLIKILGWEVSSILIYFFYYPKYWIIKQSLE